MRVAIILFFISQMLIGCGTAVDSWPMSRFDQAKWSQTDEGNRFVFVRNLIESKKLKGLTRPQVIELLGKPSDYHMSEEYVTYIVKADSDGLYFLDIRFKTESEQKVVDIVGIRTD